MTTGLVIELHNRQQAWAAIKAQVFPFLASCLQAGSVWVLTIGRKKRTIPQNRRYWGKGVLFQIAQQAAPGGRLYSPEIWHEQFKRQFIGVEELPNGEVIGKSSAGLSTTEFSDFCAQVEAYAASDLGVVFYDQEARQASAFRPGKDSAKPVRASSGATDQSAAVAQEHQPCELFPIARA